MSLIKKLIKAALALLVLAALTLAAWGIWRFKQNPLVSTLPLPYQMDPHTIALMRLWPEFNTHPPEQVQVLFAGDEFALEMWKWREAFNLELSRDLSSSLRLGIIASSKEGLHRLAQRLKLMEHLPRIVVLMTGGAEGVEQIFELSEYQKIKANLQWAQNPWPATLLEFFPELSRITYRPTKMVEIMPEVKSFRGQLFDYEYQMAAELSYSLFKLQLTDLIHYLQKRKVQVVLSTLPVKLEEIPRGICQKAQQEELAKKSMEVWGLLKEGRSKEALGVVERMQVAQNPSPLGYYLLALAQQKNGDLSSAKENYQMATAFDCQLWRANYTINSIIREVALDNDVPLFDFEQWHNLDFGKNTLFLNSTIPQPLYMEKGASLLGRTLRSYLRL